MEQHRYRLADVVQGAITDRLIQTRVATPGIVQSYDAQTQTVSAAVAYLGEQVIVPAVPVVVMSGGTASITFPITPGDSCLLICCDRDLQSWKASTGQLATTQGTVGAHTIHRLTDAVAIVGVYPTALAPAGDNVNLNITNGNAKIVLGQNTVALGANGVELIDQIIEAFTLINPSVAFVLTPVIEALQGIQGTI